MSQGPISLIRVTEWTSFNFSFCQLSLSRRQNVRLNMINIQYQNHGHLGYNNMNITQENQWKISPPYGDNFFQKSLFKKKKSEVGFLVWVSLLGLDYM